MKFTISKKDESLTVKGKHNTDEFDIPTKDGISRTLKKDDTLEFWQIKKSTEDDTELTIISMESGSVNVSKSGCRWQVKLIDNEAEISTVNVEIGDIRPTDEK